MSILEPAGDPSVIELTGRIADFNAE